MGSQRLGHDRVTEQQNLQIAFKKHLRENELCGSVHLYWAMTERMSPGTRGWFTNRNSLLSTFHGLSQQQHWITLVRAQNIGQNIGVRVHLSHWFSNLRAHQNHLENLVTQDCQVLFQSFWTRRIGARGLFLTSSQVMLMLLWWAYLEDQWSLRITGLSHVY